MTRTARLLPAALLLASALAGGSERLAQTLTPPDTRAPVRELAVTARPDGTLLLAGIIDNGRFSSGRGSSTARVLRTWVSGPGGWTPLGGVLNYHQPRPLASLNLVADGQGGALLAWNENYADNDVVEFRVLDGGTWTDWGDRYLGDDLPYAARTRAVALWKGQPFLAWGEWLRDSGGSQLTVRTWNDTQESWVRGPRFNDRTQFSRTPALTVTQKGQPVVAWLQGEVTASRVLAARWTGQAWQPLGGPLNRHAPGYVAATRLVLDGQDRPIAAWIEDHAGQDTLYAARWTGQNWHPLGAQVSQNFASAPSLSTDDAGHAALAWVEEVNGTGQVHLARWTGQSWTDQGVQNRDPRRDARSPSLTTAPNGTLTLAWREDAAGTYRIELRQYPGL
ncbi:hypothetical protein [Deinococcus radiotolerans]|uniref:Uncharacterized protein n=1 Tax=Deinococcus radiotolerans TaxID=1309407 RepID=A0ABQ2FK45_9DEIO|nr:hypothetical protein [Deinococcus radiotolerans]GGL05955.1 hypothetical protein GCM10010844_25900 [Deinococcus radiotolerans]